MNRDSLFNKYIYNIHACAIFLGNSLIVQNLILRVSITFFKSISEDEEWGGNEKISNRNEGRKSKEKGEKEKKHLGGYEGAKREGRDEEEKVQECGRRETVCGAAGGRPSVHCKSPSTAFNYDVIANTDDGYFLRYTLYITRGPTKPSLEPRAVRLLCVYGVLTTRPCDCFRMFQDMRLRLLNMKFDSHRWYQAISSLCHVEDIYLN